MKTNKRVDLPVNEFIAQFPKDAQTEIHNFFKTYKSIEPSVPVVLDFLLDALEGYEEEDEIRYLMRKIDGEEDVLFDSDIDYLGQYECSRCLEMNYQNISEGEAGECGYCDEVDYWDLNAVQIDHQWYSLDEAYELLKKRKSEH